MSFIICVLTLQVSPRAGEVAQIDENENTDDNDDSKEEEWANALKLRPNGLGDKVEWSNMKAEPKETKAHGRYTEAMLIRELERYSIGRPSTFASLIATIKEHPEVVIQEGLAVIGTTLVSSLAVLFILTRRFNLPEALGIALTSGILTTFIRRILSM